MKNRAKCKLCNSVIESFHDTDYVMCSCGAISVDGGTAMRCAAVKWEHFVRVDDEGNEIIVKVENSDVKPLYNDEKPKTTKKDLLFMLDEMIKNIESLPQHVMVSPINHYDYCSLLILLSEMFKED